MGNKINLQIACRQSPSKVSAELGATWAQNSVYALRNQGVLASKANGFNGTYGRGGGDRTHDLRLKRPLLYH